MSENGVFFAPQLYIKRGIKDISFYSDAFGAVESKRFLNDDGTIHVAELVIDGVIFHLHEEVSKPYFFNAQKYNGTTVLLGLFVADVDAVMARALAAGAVEISAARDYDYGYRQGELKDPFGHYWLIEMKI